MTFLLKTLLTTFFVKLKNVMKFFFLDFVGFKSSFENFGNRFFRRNAT